MDERLAELLKHPAKVEPGALLAILRDRGAIVRIHDLDDGRVAFTTKIRGHSYVGRGATELDAALAIVLACRSFPN